MTILHSIKFKPDSLFPESELLELGALTFVVYGLSDWAQDCRDQHEHKRDSKRHIQTSKLT
jgi:hypothetical protein